MELSDNNKAMLKDIEKIIGKSTRPVDLIAALLVRQPDGDAFAQVASDKIPMSDFGNVIRILIIDALKNGVMRKANTQDIAARQALLETGAFLDSFNKHPINVHKLN